MPIKGFIEFRLNRCKRLTARSLKKITSNYPKLQFLGFSFIQAKSEDLDCLLNCPNLVYLEALGFPITDRELEILGRLTKLEYVYLTDVRCSKDGLKHLYAWKKLDKCTLINSKLDPAWVEDLQAHLPGATILSKQAVPTEVNDMFGMFLDQKADPMREINLVKPQDPKVPLK